MRSFPWSIRVGLFAVGLGAGLLHSQPHKTQPSIIVRIQLARPGIQTTSTPERGPLTLPCSLPARNPQTSL
jgi:hypothetical protein